MLCPRMQAKATLPCRGTLCVHQCVLCILTDSTSTALSNPISRGSVGRTLTRMLTPFTGRPDAPAVRSAEARNIISSQEHSGARHQKVEVGQNDYKRVHCLTSFMC